MADEAPTAATAFGPNAWLVDEMYERYRADPGSVAASWQDFFEDWRPEMAIVGGPTRVRPPQDGLRDGLADEAAPAPTEPLRGAAARLAANMEASLGVPTATSVRVVPARLLEVNRRMVDRYLERTVGGKVSFTHIIGYAVVRAVAAIPVMNSSFARRGGGDRGGGDRGGGDRGGGDDSDQRASVVRPPHVGLGLAVDLPRPDGSRALLVPCIRDADTLDFRAFVAAFEDKVRAVRTGRVTADDFTGVTMTLTNPGTLGTVQSVPRLLPGQGVIVAVGALDYPAEFHGADSRVLAEMGIGKVITLTSTYDHRVIQGAESGLFLQRVADLLMGSDRFYEDVFSAIGVPYEPVQWRPDRNPVSHNDVAMAKQVHVQSLINMYRVRGHLIADLDPLGFTEPHTHTELDPATYGLTIWDLEREFFTDGLARQDWMKLGDILGVLRDAYCRRVGVEYMHIQDPVQKCWIQEQVEGVPSALDPGEQQRILDRLNAAEAFERFLHSRYVGHKRFGLEGAESAICLIDEVLDCAAKAGYHEAVMGMAHRGRLNLLANIVGKSLRQIFREFEGDLDPATTHGSGDVKYHVGATGKFVGRSGISLPVTLASNPSHLEAVDPVVEGMVRAKQDLFDEPEMFGVLPLVIHGDAAFSGQGVVAETLNLSALRGYRVGGTIHLVINNQVGFTTAPAAARSSIYPTDVAKMVQAPILHVNGDDPEACVRVARLAFRFRQEFHRDVVIDLVCYRLHGHNEGDDPSYTQPLMYRRIEAHRSVRKLYTETLVRRGDLTLEQAEAALDDFLARMQASFEETHQSAPPDPVRARSGSGAVPAEAGGGPTVTGVPLPILQRVVTTLASPPAGFTVHPKLAQVLEAHTELWRQGVADWYLGEALAFGSLLAEGFDIRLTGQDTRRGTFSQRHATLVDYQTGKDWTPLAQLGAPPAPGDRPAKFWAYDSMLSEYAALGFEYGYSVVHRDALVVWEAQFGDFANGAQVVIDQFVAAAEDKWGQASGLVLMLPHGYEGQGPEHSSARVERFLALCAAGNLRVVNPTTPAQIFHVLRRQVHHGVRKPLVLLTPKSLLRARHARSPVADFQAGSFQPVIDDAAMADRRREVKRLVLCSGKVAYEAAAVRDELDVAVPVVRVEQLYPWPSEQIAEVLGRYEAATEVMWLQEEPENMGPWSFVHGRIHRLLENRGWTLRHAARRPSPAPASGSQAVHAHEQAEILTTAFSGS